MKPTFSIPKISDDRLAELSGKMRPVFRGSDGKLLWMKPVDLRTQSFLWDPIADGLATDLQAIRTIRTLHTWAYYGFFKPSVAEVIAQIPPRLLPMTIAFETIGPQDAADLNRESAALNAGFHVARTILYQLALYLHGIAEDTQAQRLPPGKMPGPKEGWKF